MALFAAVHMSLFGRYCCKSLFALVIKNSPGCRRDFRVKMWGTSSPDDKLTGDLGNVIEATSIGGRRSDFFYSSKIGAGQFGTFSTASTQSRPKPSRNAGLRSGTARGSSFNDGRRMGLKHLNRDSANRNRTGLRLVVAAVAWPPAAHAQQVGKQGRALYRFPSAGIGARADRRLHLDHQNGPLAA